MTDPPPRDATAPRPPPRAALAGEAVVPFLMSHRLIAECDVVDGDLEILEVSRRNLNYRVTSSGPSYLMKQGIGAEKVRMIAHEAAVYRLLWSRPGPRPPETFLPRCCLHDADRAVLVLELIRDSRTLNAHFRALGRFPKRVARELGHLLADVHGPGRSERSDEALSIPAPFALSLHRPDLRLFESASRAAIELIRIVHQSAELCALLDAVGAMWRPDALMHGDLRWDNCHVVSRPAWSSRGALRIVDWELAGLGDRAWDVGTIFCEYLTTWLQSAPISGMTPPREFLRFSRYPVEKMWPAIRAFWRAYVEHGGAGSEAAADLLLRATSYTATRLLQTAFEWVQLATQVSDHAIFLLQLGLNILRQPVDAAERLLGIHADRDLA